MIRIIVHILIFATHTVCLEWIKLLPLKKEFTVTENILSYLTPEEDPYNGESFIRLPHPTFSTKYDNVTLTTSQPIVLSAERIRFDNDTESFKIGGFNIGNKIIANRSKIIEKDAFANKSINDPITLEKVLPLLKNLQYNLFTKIPVALKDKTKFLQNIHDDILIHIEDSINALWPNERIRRKRATKDSDSHLDFPSSETALMTISFLTFAVYLIKLILQVVNILKNKKGTMYTVMGTGRITP